MTTYQVSAESLVNFMHGARERMKLGASLTAFLKLALKAVQYVVKSEAAFARLTHIGAHTADTC
jgi:hypothetical protein